MADEKDKPAPAATPAAKPEVKKPDFSKLKVKDEYHNEDGTVKQKSISSPHLTRPVSLQAMASNPKLYLRAECRKYLQKGGEGSYPLFAFFDKNVLTEDMIKAIAAA